MKYIVILAHLCYFSILHSQNPQEFTFKFNVKKWQISNQKLYRIHKNELVVINLFDVSGNPIQFNATEKSISEQPLKDIKIFKGKSNDNKKIISLTVAKKSMSGSYLESGIQYFIEPLKNKCNKYKVYTHTIDTSESDTILEKDFTK
jgi:hypothetical protein